MIRLALETENNLFPKRLNCSLVEWLEKQMGVHKEKGWPNTRMKGERNEEHGWMDKQNG